MENNNMYVGTEYMVDPSSIRFDQYMVEFNRTYTESEYLQTKLSIESIGQQVPIHINNKTGLCENGRHRVQICKELGIQVKCIQVDGTLSIPVRLELYNLDQMSGKELTTGQKAIQAHKYAKIAKVTLDYAASRFNTNRRAVAAANTIAGLGRVDILDAVHSTGYWKDDQGNKIKDLRTIAKHLKSSIDDTDVLAMDAAINYEDLITTEKGKAEFWRKRTLVNMSQHELNIVLVEYMNMKYKLKIDSETGEVDDDE